MKNTLGKRIAAGRKRMKLTQDQLAEKLGVTAQAVSKWENDQSCPDITMLPKLAEIFGTTTDALLGMEEEKVHTAEVVPPAREELESDGFHFENGKMEFRWDGGRRGSLGFALWVLLVGVLKIATIILFHDRAADLWHLAWTSGLMLFGLFGLYPKFSFLRLGCALFGGYFLICLNFKALPYNNGLLLPAILVLLGLSLLFEALRKSKKPIFSINGISDNAKLHNRFICEDERFDCTTSFGEDSRRISLPRLSGGRASVSFGELTLDVTHVEEFAPDCRLDLSCSFGELDLLVPRTCRIKHEAKTAFATVEVKGAPNADAEREIYLNCDVSFGEICIRYI